MSDLTTTGLIIAGGQQALIAVKEFATKLLSPAIEEAGLIFKDEVAVYRFKNQIRLFAKTKEICETNGISTKAISPKLLLPLIDHASLEDDEVLQDKWAILLSNLVDSEQNIENHVFPYLLSQISREEFIGLEGLIKSHLEIHDHSTLSTLYFHIEISDYQISKIPSIHRSNLIRLGIFERNVQLYEYAERSSGYSIPKSTVKSDYRITFFGILFMKACTEKKNQ